MTLFIFDPHIRPEYPHVQLIHNCLDMAGNDDIVFGGDFLEGMMFPLKVIYADPEVNKLLTRIRALPNVSILEGNHDPPPESLAYLFQKQIFKVMRIHGKTVIHGDFLDPRLDTELERALVSIMGRAVEKLNLGWLNRIARNIAKGKDNENEKMMAQAKIRLPGVEVVCGHSHIPKEADGYLNGGTIQNGDYVTADSEGWKLCKMDAS